MIKRLYCLLYIIIICINISSEINAQPTNCSIKNIGNHTTNNENVNNQNINNGNITGNLYQAGIINITINITPEDYNTTFLDGSDLYSAVKKDGNKLLLKNNVFKLDTVNKQKIAREVLTSQPKDGNCINDLIKEKISLNQFETYVSQDDASVKLIKYLVNDSEIRNFTIIYNQSDGYVRIRVYNKIHYLPFSKNLDKENHFAYYGNVYDYGGDYNNGIALIGTREDERNEMVYHFIDKNGVQRGSDEYIKFYNYGDFYLLKRKSDNKNQLFSKEGNLVVGNVDSNSIFGKNLHIKYKNNIYQLPYFKNIDTIRTNPKAFKVETIFNQFGFLTSKNELIYRLFENINYSIIDENIIKVITPDGQFIYNPREDLFSKKYVTIGDFDEYKRAVCTQFDNNKVLIKDNGKEMLYKAYNIIDILKKEMIVKIGNKYYKSLIDQKIKSEEGYDKLKFIDDLGRLFWMNITDSNTIESGIIFNNIKIKFPHFPPCYLEPGLPDENKFRGIVDCYHFNKYKLAVVKSGSARFNFISGSSLISENGDILFPFSCPQLLSLDSFELFHLKT